MVLPCEVAVLCELARQAQEATRSRLHAGLQRDTSLSFLSPSLPASLSPPSLLPCLPPWLHSSLFTSVCERGAPTWTSGQEGKTPKTEAPPRYLTCAQRA